MYKSALYLYNTKYYMTDSIGGDEDIQLLITCMKR